MCYRLGIRSNHFRKRSDYLEVASSGGKRPAYLVLHEAGEKFLPFLPFPESLIKDRGVLGRRGSFFPERRKNRPASSFESLARR